MNRIEAARLKKGLTAEAISQKLPAEPGGAESHTLSGRALIFWDKDRPGR